MQSYVPSSRQNFSALRVGNIPIIVVLTKADEMRVEIRRKLTASGVTPTDENVENRLEEIIEEKRNEITGLVGRSFVPVGQCKCPARISRIKSLTALLLHSDRLGQESSLSDIPEP